MDSPLARPLLLSQSSAGPLWMWEDPEPDLQYAIGVDTSSGRPGGDPLVAEVIEMESCRQVAEWCGLVDPEEFGKIVTRLSWLFNNAEVGIETHPSPHGLRVYDAAADYGCETLYAQESWDHSGQVVRRKGWITSEQGKVVLIGRINTALAAGTTIRSKRLLNELLNAQFDENDRVHRRCKNDCMIAFAIALRIRDTAYQQGRIQPVVQRELDFHERWWADFDRRSTSGKVPGALTDEAFPEYDGI